METEIWKDIPGYEGIYRISNVGNKIESYWTRMKWRILKPAKAKTWYLSVVLCNKWILRSWFVHRLKAITFIEKKMDKTFINHIDGNKLNNEISNLEWCTMSENIKHAHKIWLISYRFRINHPCKGKFWENNQSAKQVIQYTISWDIIKIWGSIIDAEKHYSISNISHVCYWRRKTAWWYKWKFKI